MYKNFPDHYIYPAVIEHCEDNYCLYYPDLPGCASSGDTVEKAVELHNPNFKPVEFDGFKTRAGANAFTMSPKSWRK